MIDKKIKGLVLAGGNSTRMGENKALLRYHGKAQVDHLVSLLGIFCSQVFVSLRPEQFIPGKFRLLHDRYPFESPLNGILTAIKSDTSCAWLTVPVDMPAIDRQLLNYLLANRDRSKNVTCFADSGGSLPEPLVAVWEPGNEKSLDQFVASGKISVREYLTTNPIQLLAIPRPEYHINVNTKSDYQAYSSHQK